MAAKRTTNGRAHPRTPVVRPSRAWDTWLVALLIAAVAVIAYANAFAGVLVFDDLSSIADNPNIRSLGRSLHTPAETVTLAGRPVASFTFGLNYALAPRESRDVFSAGQGADAAPVHANLWGYHAVNLVVHVLAALVLFGVVRRTLRSPRLEGRFGSVATPLAACVSLLWVAHPLTTSAVTYVVQRVESLMALLYLLTVYCAIRCAPGLKAGGPTPSGNAKSVIRHSLWEPQASAWGRGIWSAAAVVACALGMATKETMVSAPIVVCLYDWVFLGPPNSGSRRSTGWRPRWRLYGLLASTWVVLVWLLIGNPREASVGIGLHGWSAWGYLKTQAMAIVHYLKLVFVPWPLSLSYEWSEPTLGRALPYMLLLAALGIATVWGIVRRHGAGFAGACFFLVLAPTSSILPITTEVVAEHRMYLALACVISVVVVGIYGLAWDGRWAAWFRERARSWRLGAVVGVAVVVSVLGYRTHLRNDDYRSEDRIWAEVVAREPASARAQANYGWALLREGRHGDAEQHLRTALALQPRYAEAEANLGIALAGQNRLEEAIEHLRRAASLSPALQNVWFNLGEALQEAGRDQQAGEAYTRALASAPDDVMLLNRLAAIRATSATPQARDGGVAVTLAERAVALTGNGDPVSLDTLAASYAEAGRFPDAVRAGERALAAAERRGQTDAAPGIRYRIELYRAGIPFRRSAPRRP